MARFFNVTGLTATTIRAAASAPGFTASILDYVLEDEPLLRVFAAEAEIAPGELLRARVGLESRGDAAPQAAGHLLRHARTGRYQRQPWSPHRGPGLHPDDPVHRAGRARHAGARGIPGSRLQAV